jgi:hypothetical protein
MIKPPAPNVKEKRGLADIQGRPVNKGEVLAGVNARARSDCLRKVTRLLLKALSAGVCQLKKLFNE